MPRPRLPLGASAAASLLTLLLHATSASAAVAEARGPVVLRDKPAAGARVVERVAAKRRLEVLGRTADGNWLHVQGAEFDGWVPTSAVELVGSGATAGDSGGGEPEGTLARRRNVRSETWVSSSKYHDGNDNKITVTAPRAELYGRPAVGSSVVGMLRRGDVVAVVRKSTDQKWILVDIGGGEMAWILASATRAGAARGGQNDEIPVEQPTDAPPPPPPSPRSGRGGQLTPSQVRSDSERPSRLDSSLSRGDEEVPQDRPSERPVTRALDPDPPRRSDRAVERRPPERRPRESATSSGPPRVAGPNNHFAVGLNGGLAILQQRFTSNGVNELANYEAQTVATALGVGLRYTRVLVPLFRLGLDLSYQFVGGGGVRVKTPTASGAVLGLQSHFIDVGVVPALHFSAAGGIDLGLSIGMHMALNLVEANALAPLPSDRVLGLALGLRLELPALVSIGERALGLHAHATVLAPADRAQTAGLEDGFASTTIGADFGGRVSLQLYRGLGLSLGYRYGFAVSHFTGIGRRDPMSTVADRGTAQHLLGLHLGYAF